MLYRVLEGLARDLAFPLFGESAKLSSSLPTFVLAQQGDRKNKVLQAEVRTNLGTDPR